MRVIIFGATNPMHPRNMLFKKALNRLGHKIIDGADMASGLTHYMRVCLNFWKHGRKSDVIYIGVLGHYDLPLAWILAKIFRKKIIFDCYFSLYDTYVNDRKVSKKKSWASLRFSFYDWCATRIPDVVILDTLENIDFFIKRYNARPGKFFEIPVSADPNVFKFNQKNTAKLRVGFYGSFLPLHGVDLIIDAAKLIKNKKIKFHLLGKGPGLAATDLKIKRLRLENKVELTKKQIAYYQIPLFLSKIDLFLAGPFGKSEKAKRIITAKTAEALASGIPTVVSKNPATTRLLKDYRGLIIWLNENKPSGLARSIEDYFKKNRKNDKDYFSMSNLSFDKFQSNIKRVLDSVT